MVHKTSGITEEYRDIVSTRSVARRLRACFVVRRPIPRVPPLFAIAGAGIGGLYILFDAVSNQKNVDTYRQQPREGDYLIVNRTGRACSSILLQLEYSSYLVVYVQYRSFFSQNEYHVGFSVGAPQKVANKPI